MSYANFIIGLVLFFFCLGLSGSIGIFFTAIPTASLDLFKIGFIFMGIVSVIIGAFK